MPTYCCDLARAADEPLIGTASRNDFQLVLSLPKTEWLGKLEAMDGLAGALAALVQPLKDQAILSLKHGPAEERGTVWLFPHGYHFGPLDPALYAELVAQVLNGQISLPYTRIEHQVLLICTHGKRDAACAKYGGEVIKALQAHPLGALQAWEVSHLGGHRFAGTAVLQPQSHWYGFLTPADLPALLEAAQTGQPLLSHYRGNSHYAAPLQVAEAWGWGQLAQAGLLGDIHLFNPLLDGAQAQVVVGVEQGGQLTKFQVTLTGRPYAFIPDTDSTETKERLIWQMASAKRL
jgi:hypothetical protein